MYWRRLAAALQGKDLPCCRCNDQPVRDAQCEEVMELLNELPATIPNSTDKTSVENLSWMLRRLLRERDVFPVDKTGRWIGFVHGVLALAGSLDVDKVRDRSRPRFQRAYRATGQPIPKTLEHTSEG